MRKITLIVLALALIIGSMGGCSSGKQSVAPASEYEVNKEYKFDLDGDGKDDVLMVETDGQEHYSIMVNGKAITLEVLPELALHKYRLTKIDNSKKYAITVFVASPPNEDEIYFYEFKKPLDIVFIGKVVGAELGFNDSISNLTASQVKVGTKNFTFSDIK